MISEKKLAAYSATEPLHLELRHIYRTRIRNHPLELDSQSHLFGRIPHLGLPGPLVSAVLFIYVLVRRRLIIITCILDTDTPFLWFSDHSVHILCPHIRNILIFWSVFQREEYVFGADTILRTVFQMQIEVFESDRLKNYK